MDIQITIDEENTQAAKAATDAQGVPPGFTADEALRTLDAYDGDAISDAELIAIDPFAIPRPPIMRDAIVLITGAVHSTLLDTLITGNAEQAKDALRSYIDALESIFVRL